MSSLEWMCQHCGYGPMSCSSDKECLVCQDPQQPGDCNISKPSTSGLPRHPPPSKVNVSKGIALKHTRGGRRHKKNKSRKYKRKHM